MLNVVLLVIELKETKVIKWTRIKAKSKMVISSETIKTKINSNRIVKEQPKITTKERM